VIRLPYGLEYEQTCREAIDGATRKNKTLKIILEKKVSQVLEEPHHYKPLHPPLNNKFRVHVAKSFILIFEIDEMRQVVILKKFSHHDYAYI
jgi:mRNA-degrading endonuclease RelE of RelBE toxin-antitoxin system